MVWFPLQDSASRPVKAVTMAVGLTLAMVAFAAPTQAWTIVTIGSGDGGPTPCIRVDLNDVPPVGVDPNCPSMLFLLTEQVTDQATGSDQQSSFPVQASLAGLDVLVSWEPPADVTNITSFAVFRGPDPDRLAYLGNVSADEHTYLDTGASGRSDALWYRVVVMREGEPLIASEPVFIGIGRA